MYICINTTKLFTVKPKIPRKSGDSEFVTENL